VENIWFLDIIRHVIYKVILVGEYDYVKASKFPCFEAFFSKRNVEGLRY